jgi:hypothetical protein
MINFGNKRERINLELKPTSVKIKYDGEYCIYSSSQASRVAANCFYMHHLIRCSLDFRESLIAEVGATKYRNLLSYSDIPRSIETREALNSNQISEIEKNFLGDINRFLEVTNDFHIVQGYNFPFSEFSAELFSDIRVRRIRNRAGIYLFGGGLFGVYESNKLTILAALVIKTEAVQLPKLVALHNYADIENPHSLENVDDLFKIYVQAGFDYKDTEYKNLRKVYRKHLLPFAAENNIKIETVPDLNELLIAQVGVPVYSNRFEKEEKEAIVIKNAINAYLAENRKELFTLEDAVEQTLW